MAEIDATGAGNPLLNLPTYPGQGESVQGQGQPNPALAAQLAALLGPNAAGDVQSVQKPRGPTSNKFSGGVVTMPPPPAPRTKATPQTQAAYDSLSQELGAAFAGAQAQGASRGPTPPGAPLTPSTNPQVAASQAAAWLNNCMKSLQNGQGDLLAQFMKLRLQNSIDGLNDLQTLSDLSSAIQNDAIKQELAKSQAAQAEAQKAQEKSQKLAAVSTGMTIVMAILTAVVAVLTFGAGLGLALVGAAAAIGFVVGGAVGGKKEGKAFDGMAGLEGATFGADAAMMACGIGACVMAAREALSEGGKQAMLKAAQAAAKAAAEKGATEAAESAGTTAARGLAKQGVAEATEKSIETLAELSAKEWREAFMTVFQQAYGKNFGRMAREINLGPLTLGKQSADFGGHLMWTALGVEALQASMSLTRAGIQYDVTKHQTNSEEDEATVKLMKALADLMNNIYKAPQDLMQTLTQSHSKTVDQVQSMLKSQQQVLQKVNSNLSL